MTTDHVTSAVPIIMDNYFCLQEDGGSVSSNGQGGSCDPRLLPALLGSQTHQGRTPNLLVGL